MTTTPRAALALLGAAALAAALAPSTYAAPTLDAPNGTAGSSADGAPDSAVATVFTDNETPVLYDDEDGGMASGDDPAIWVHPTRSARSLVIVTAKEGGLRAYDLDGKQVQALPATKAPMKRGAPGRYNNVDILNGVKLRGDRTDIAAVSDRYNDTIRFFAIDPAGSAAPSPLREVTAPGQDYLFSANRKQVESESTAYGLAVHQPATGRPSVVVTQEGTTRVATARVRVRGGRVGYDRVRTTAFPTSFPLADGSTWTPCEEPGTKPQLEGVSVDQRTGVLYAAQEDVGLWRLPLPLGRAGGEPTLIDKVTDFGIHDAYDAKTEECEPIDAGDAGEPGEHLVADAEGVDVYHGKGKGGYVIVSSQGDDTFSVYDIADDDAWVGTFRVAGKGVDPINGSDGLAVTNRRVGGYTTGLLVTHDEPESGRGVDADRSPTNFSYVSFGDVAKALDLKVSTKRGNDPRFR